MVPAGVRAVAFDAVGTLIRPDPPAPVVYAEVGSGYGSRYGPESIAARFADAFRLEEERDRAAGWRTSEARERQRWRAIVAHVLDDVDEPDACFRELLAHFARPAAWRCDPEAHGVLEALAVRGYRPAVASNYDGRLRKVTAGLSELRAVGDVIVSADLGWRKPAREFFSGFCGVLGLSPPEVLHVGDDRANDYGGASAAGLRAVLLDPDARAGPGVVRVRRLGELLGP
jgi:putative hydrolase of the HAD superfamily